MGRCDLRRLDSRGAHRAVPWSRWNWNSRLALLFLSRVLAEMRPDPRRQLVLDSARVRSLVGDAHLQEVVKNRLAFDFEFPRQIIDSNLNAHLFIGLPARKHASHRAGPERWTRTSRPGPARSTHRWPHLQTTTRLRNPRHRHSLVITDLFPLLAPCPPQAPFDRPRWSRCCQAQPQEPPQPHPRQLSALPRSEPKAPARGAPQP